LVLQREPQYNAVQDERTDSPMTIIHKIEPQFDNPECISNSEDSNKYNYSVGLHGEKINHAAFLEYIRTPKRATVKYRDGFLTLSDIVKPAYECECGFNGLIADVKCAKCGETV